MIADREASSNGHGASGLEALAEATRHAAASDRAGLRDAHDRVFRALAAALVEGRVTGREFERLFLESWRLYRDNHITTSAAVDTLFTDVDDYCGDPNL